MGELGCGEWSNIRKAKPVPCVLLGKIWRVTEKGRDREIEIEIQREREGVGERQKQVSAYS